MLIDMDDLSTESCSWCQKTCLHKEMEYRGNLVLCDICQSFSTKSAMELAKSYIITVANNPEYTDQDKVGWVGF